MNIQLNRFERKKRGIYTFAPLGSWSNNELAKDNGLITYLFHKKFDYEGVIVMEKRGDYPILNNELKGLKIDDVQIKIIAEENEKNVAFSYIKYIRQNYMKIDILVLRSLYVSNQYILHEYRKHRPDGLVFMYLDMNSNWARTIDWNNPVLINTFKQCNLVSTSSKKIAEQLTEAMPIKVEYIPNGFFNLSGNEIEVDFDKKKNVILTVGRIGTAQKANHILLQAFAKIAHICPEWNVHLVGNIDKEFEKYIKKFFKVYPKLRKRIFFKGVISDKKALYKEYGEAKIFALTSVLEGGAPNVIGEALGHGCSIVTSNIDAADEIVNNGLCGSVFPINDVDRLAEILKEMCKNEEMLKKMSSESIKNVNENYNWDKVIVQIKDNLISTP